MFVNTNIIDAVNKFVRADLLEQQTHLLEIRAMYANLTNSELRDAEFTRAESYNNLVLQETYCECCGQKDFCTESTEPELAGDLVCPDCDGSYKENRLFAEKQERGMEDLYDPEFDYQG